MPKRPAIKKKPVKKTPVKKAKKKLATPKTKRNAIDQYVNKESEHLVLEQGEFDVILRDDTVETVAGQVVGCFGIREDDREWGWCVTHIPTGMVFGYHFPNVMKTLCFVAAVHKLIDWDFTLQEQLNEEAIPLMKGLRVYYQGRMSEAKTKQLIEEFEARLEDYEPDEPNMTGGRSLL